MAAGYVAINDINALCGTTKFKTCIISFRKKLDIYPLDKNLKLSQLINIRIAKHKDQVLCYCDGFTEELKSEEDSLIQQDDVIISNIIHEDPELEDEFPGLYQEEITQLKDEREEVYEKEKITWINRFSSNENIIQAIKSGYLCDDEYCNERMQKEWPGFFVIDETTLFWKCGCPSLHSIKIEKRLSHQLSGFKSKYGTYTRIVKLEQHTKINYDDCEAVVIFNYLGKFDIIAIINQLDNELYGME